MAIDFSNSDFDSEELEPLVTTSLTREDEGEYSLRPKTLREYIGQEKAKGNLEVFIQAAKMRNEPLDHVLLHGPPGLGKTTLSGIIANEMGVNVRITSGPAIEKAGDLAALLTNLNENDILFVDEIHRLGAQIQVDGKVAVIEGVDRLTGAPVQACDLRAGAAMVIAGLAAHGTTEVDQIQYIERGYEDIVRKLSGLGADIRVVVTPDEEKQSQVG